MYLLCPASVDIVTLCYRMWHDDGTFLIQTSLHSRHIWCGALDSFVGSIFLGGFSALINRSADGSSVVGSSSVMEHSRSRSLSMFRADGPGLGSLPLVVAPCPL
ncbi:hypothetical protein J6590_020932 [Homalodisca vitripennis]|nr:hypothetical protein J6590_020932 [Homalodisca vitripennis]